MVIQLTRVLSFLASVVGAVTIVWGLVVYFTGGGVETLLIPIAILIVGPGEDWLNGYVTRKGKAVEERKELVNQVTSLAFVVLLLAAVYWA